MTRKVTVTFEPLGVKVVTEAGKTVLNVARENGIVIRSECAGKGTCGKCKVILRNPQAANKLTNAEKEHLHQDEIREGFRLACLTKIKKDLVLTIPKESRTTLRKIQIFGLERYVKLKPNVEKFHLSLEKPTLEMAKPDFERLTDELKKRRDRENDYFDIDYGLLKKLPNIIRKADWRITVTLWNRKKIIAVEAGNTADKVCGLAIDVGTSKIVIYIVDLKTGNVLGTGAIENPQMIYGEDIVSRITYAASDDKCLSKLQSTLVKGVNEAIGHICTDAGVNHQNIYEAIFVGNTAMHHLFFEFQPKYISLSPYTPVLGGPFCVKASDAKVKMNPNGMICSLPIIGGFVGPDAVADIVASGIYKKNEVSLLLDIGTNTEVVLGSRIAMESCSCASGPAFEGIHIKQGVKAVDGAIEHVRLSRSALEVEYDTINDLPPIGICGTGIIDALAEMLKYGIISPHGRFINKLRNSRLKEIAGQKCFVLVPKGESGIGCEIVITQKDINEIQLAKAAIFASCSVLMKRMKLPRKDISKVFIAGAFGTYINPENAKILGLVPDIETRRIGFVGNSAIVGAKMALVSTHTREKASEIASKTVYVELAADSNFMSEFLKALPIPHKELDRFPSVRKVLEKTSASI